jgi:hypothetical protein
MLTGRGPLVLSSFPRGASGEPEVIALQNDGELERIATGYSARCDQLQGKPAIQTRGPVNIQFH